MPVTYKIDIPRKLIRTICVDPLTLDEVIHHFRALAQDPTCAGYLDVFLDLTAANAPPQSNYFSAITAEMGAVREKVQFGFCAIIAPRDVMFGMMRMFEVYSAPYFRGTRVFREIAEAEAWLSAQESARGSGK